MENANNQSVYASKPWQQRYDYWVPKAVSFPTPPIYQILNLASVHYPDQPATAINHEDHKEHEEFLTR